MAKCVENRSGTCHGAHAFLGKHMWKLMGDEEHGSGNEWGIVILPASDNAFWQETQLE